MLARVASGKKPIMVEIISAIVSAVYIIISTGDKSPLVEEAEIIAPETKNRTIKNSAIATVDSETLLLTQI